MIARAEPHRVGGTPWLVAALDQILVWIERSKQRAQLGDLEPQMLQDLGLSRADLDTECGKHFWQQ